MRKHITPGTVLGLIAVLFAMTGSAFAANSLITSKDIKDGTIKKRDLSGTVKDKLNKVGKTGPAGTNGVNGKDGATGPQGPAGAKGAKGDKGDSGVANLESDGPYPGRPDSANNLQNLGTDLDEGAQSTEAWTSDGLQQSWVMCPDGKVALGGGFGDNDHDANLNIVTSSPVRILYDAETGTAQLSSDGPPAYEPIEGDEAGSYVPNGWLVEGHYVGDDSVIVRPHVVCANVG